MATCPKISCGCSEPRDFFFFCGGGRGNKEPKKSRSVYNHRKSQIKEKKKERRGKGGLFKSRTNPFLNKECQGLPAPPKK